MMAHPIHLHGHFFRVINGQGDYSPLKHTVDVTPMDTTVIEFLASEDKDWFFHCHNLYHMKSGMTRVIRYEGSKRDPALIEAAKNNPDIRDDDWYWKGYVSPQSNLVDGSWELSNIRSVLAVEWDNDYTGAYDIESSYERIITRFFSLFVGGEFDRDEDDEIENLATWGFRNTLPLLIDFEYRMDRVLPGAYPCRGQSYESHWDPAPRCLENRRHGTLDGR